MGELARFLIWGTVELDEDAIAERLFCEERTRHRIERDYCIAAGAVSACEFVENVIMKLDQVPANDPLQPRSNAQVFEAAVKALGSNSRTWASFLRNLQPLREMLGGFDPAHARGVDPSALSKLFTGTTATRDADAIINWAVLLSDLADHSENYYNFVVNLAAAIRERAQKSGIDLPDERLMLCLVGHLIDEPPKKWEGPHVGKLAGMRFALGSEFFRNLGWNGFKPDRHVIRLLSRWVPETVQNQSSAANELLPLIGRETKELRELLGYSLAGIAITPGTHYSRADNLIWLLGAYVEKKGRESHTRYVR